MGNSPQGLLFGFFYKDVLLVDEHAISAAQINGLQLILEQKIYHMLWLCIQIR